MSDGASHFAVEVFFDGACPLCMREIRWLQRLDQHSRIRFTDIQGPSFDGVSIGLSFATLMRRIHGRLPDGQLIEGVEVFRQLYAAVGFRKLVRISRFPILKQALELAYELFASNRLRLTGRCTPELCEAPPRAARLAP